jgi:hypothetical protein
MGLAIGVLAGLLALGLGARRIASVVIAAIAMFFGEAIFGVVGTSLETSAFDIESVVLLFAVAFGLLLLTTSIVWTMRRRGQLQGIGGSPFDAPYGGTGGSAGDSSSFGSSSSSSSFGSSSGSSSSSSSFGSSSGSSDSSYSGGGGTSGGGGASDSY